MHPRTVGKNLLYVFRRCMPRRSGALVLVYHSVDDFNDEYTVSRETFEWQLDEIERSGLKIISVLELEQMIERGKVEDKTVVLTFDDGRRDNFTNLFPMLSERKIPATIFSITGIIGGEYRGKGRSVPMLSESEMCDMLASSLVDFQPHTVTHPKLTTVTHEEVRHETKDSKRHLETMFSKECLYFAYPYGRHSPEIRKIVGECGIRLAFGTQAGFVEAASERLSLPRNHIRHDVTRAQFRSILKRGSLI